MGRRCSLPLRPGSAWIVTFSWRSGVSSRPTERCSTTRASVRPVVRSLATLACGDASRAAFWRDQLVAALEMLDRGDVTPDRMTGSWAGAMGHTQFMPTTYQSHAVDFDGDGTRDIWGQSPTPSPRPPTTCAHWAGARASGGATRSSSRPGSTIHWPTRPPSARSPSWIALGLRLNHDPSIIAPDASAVLVLPTGSRGPAFLLLPNFRVILRYNTALAYALSVAHLSDRLRGDQPLRAKLAPRRPNADQRRAQGAARPTGEARF